MKHIRTFPIFEKNEGSVMKRQTLTRLLRCCNRLTFPQIIIGLLILGMCGCGGDTEEDTGAVTEEDKVTGPIGMVLIPEGSFQMGSAADGANLDEQPVHTVYIDAFYMDRREVTVKAYRRFVEETGHRAPDWEQVSIYSPTDAHPIVFVSWHDAMAYAKWAGKRLPTEAEWEKAARGGLIGKTYPWGDSDALLSKCNFADKSLSDYWWADTEVDDGYRYTAPVRSYPGNKYGLHDMAGNVSEWCLDAYDPGFYAIAPDTNPISGAESLDAFESVDSARVLRGGSWRVNSLRIRTAARFRLNPDSIAPSLGFRCVMDTDPPLSAAP